MAPKAAPVASPGATVQRKELDCDLSEEQQGLRREFLFYQSAKSAALAGDPDAAAEFNRLCEDFISEVDESWNIFGTAGWGNDNYDRGLAQWFSDYDDVVAQGHAKHIADAIDAANTTVEQAEQGVAKAEEAVALAADNLTLAEAAATEAETYAVEAESAAEAAQQSAESEGAGAIELDAADRARAAAGSAREAADQAHAAVDAARTRVGDSDALLKDAESNLADAKTVVDGASGATDAWAADEYAADAATVGTKTAETTASVDETSAESTTAATSLADSDLPGQAKQGATDARVEAARAVPLAELDGHFESVDQASGSDRDAAAAELIEYARSVTAEYPAKIQAYAAQAAPDIDEKLRVVGEITTHAARVEFLLGTIYLEGSSSSEEWQTGDADSMHLYYMDEMGQGDPSETWCSIFLGTVQKNCIGRVDKDGDVPDSSNHWSGYKISKDEKWDYSEDQGGRFVGEGSGQDSESWGVLKQSLEGAGDEDARKRVVDDFFVSVGYTPQSGDAIVITRGNGTGDNDFGDKKKSHTGIVEHYADYAISTLEGNAGNGRVKGRVLDLTDPSDVARIVFMSRMSMATIPQASETGGAEATGAAVTAEELLAPIEKLDAKLQQFATDNGYVNSIPEGEENAVVNMQQ